MRRVVYAGAIIALNFGVWALANRPVEAPQWSGAVDGVAYSPMRPGDSPITGQYPSEDEIAADIAILAEEARSLRTYGIDDTLARIPEIAAQHGLPVTVGVALGADDERNRSQLARLQALVTAHANIERVIVGNETLLTEKLTPAALSSYLSEMRRQLDVPVSTAEPWHIWLQYPELAEHVDYLTVHLLPYWEGVPASVSPQLVTARVDELAATFPELPIVIGEVGWPSHGRSRGAADASRQDAEEFLRQFLNAAEPLGWDYFLMEAFDQPWKRVEEGAVGAYWGLFDAARQAKYAFDAALIPIPEWRALALLASVIAVVGFLLLTIDSQRTRWQGMALFAVTALVTGNAIVRTLHDYLHQYWTAASILGALVLLAGLLGIVLLIFVEVHEWAEANYKELTRCKPLIPDSAGAKLPSVSIHVPAYAEPPTMLIATLDALAELDYPDYEVIVIDNNTSDESLWRPVETHCKRLGDRFRFFHAADMPGYKAGALNFALEQTSPDAEIIAVVDSDYIVEREWLRQLVPCFSDPRIALVQSPQDYRDQASSAFKRYCEAEYRGFFHIGMVSRNERNAIIQHGTMTMIRADVLREVGGWAEWTVTEDAELGLRILEHGYLSLYTPTSYGRGLTPDRFRDYRSQRYRWAVGAMQILRKHARKLLGHGTSKLSMGQRFHFVAGWSAWLGDGMNLIFNLIAIAWSALMVFEPLAFLAPSAKLSGFVLAFFMFKLMKMAWLYRTRVRASVLETLAAMTAGLSLVFIAGRAIIAGLTGRDVRFIRTPKLTRRDDTAAALEVVACEALLALLLSGLAVAVMLTAPFPTVERQLWALLLFVFALPHIAAIVLSLLSCAPAGRRKTVTGQTATVATRATRQLPRAPVPAPVRNPSPADAQRAQRRV